MTPPPPTWVFLKKHGVKDHLGFGAPQKNINEKNVRNDVCDNAAALATRTHHPGFEKLDARGVDVCWMDGWDGSLFAPMTRAC
jgi:hypothetical protein